MAYVVLARKYRPRRFEDMVGQDSAVRALGNALTQQRLHHAYLFTGTRGIGKTTVSRIFAKCLNCLGEDGQGGITATPCGVCAACVQIDEDRFIDYIELDAASNRSIGEIRELLERAAYKPSIGRFKVFMIDEAHQLTKDAFNALLKTLEEPPDYVKFVLATTDPQRMPATVLSRCLQFNLRPMAPKTVRDHLSHVLKSEGIAFDDEALAVLGRAARGSMRDALSLTDQAIAFGGGRLAGDAVRAMLGSVGREPAIDLVRALAQRDGAAVVALSHALRDQGLSADGTLESMADLLQDMAVEQAVPGATDDTLPDAQAVRDLAALMPADDMQLLYSMVLHGRRELALAPDAYAGLTMVLLRLLAFAPGVAPGVEPAAAASQPAPRDGGASDDASAVPAARAVSADLRARVAPVSTRRATPAPQGLAVTQPARSTPVSAPAQGDATGLSAVRGSAAPRDPRPEPPDPVQDKPESGGAGMVVEDRALASPELARVTSSRPQSLPPEQAAQAALTPEQAALATRWAEVAQRLVEQKLVSALVRELAVQSQLVALDESPSGSTWTLRVERESLRQVAHQDKLATALTAVLGAPARVLTEAGTAVDTPARREADERARIAALAERTVREDPLVKDMLQQFKTARIVPGSIKITPEFKP